VIFIGGRSDWGKGYGAETARLMLDYGFTALGLDNIMLRVYSTNVRGIRAYTRAGFREVGRRRAAHRIGASAVDVVLMDCLPAEFRGPVLRRILRAAQEGAERDTSTADVSGGR
jgi:RimJ/RimL family protein N-acetyltransferase